MEVVKRNGSRQSVSFDKILYRISSLCSDPKLPKLNVNIVLIAQKTIRGLYDGITTSELDEIAANTAAPMATTNPEYGMLAARILTSNHHKNTLHDLSENFTLPIEVIEKHLFYYTCKALYENIDASNGQAPLLSPQVFRYVSENRDLLESIIDYNKDYMFDHIGISILLESYLTKCSIRKNNKPVNIPITQADNKSVNVSVAQADNKLVNIPITRVAIERPQHMYMRIALGIHVVDTYIDWETISLKRVNFELFKKYLDNSDYRKLIKDFKNNKLDIGYYYNLIKGYTVNISELLNEVAAKKLTWNELLNEPESRPILRRTDSNQQTNIDSNINSNQQTNIDSEIININGNQQDNIDLTTNNINTNLTTNNININLTTYKCPRSIYDTYWMLSNHYAIHATPTLFHAGTIKPQCSSCFLVALQDDSIEGITDYWKECALISKHAGGIGSSISNLRSYNSYIKGTNGVASGAVPMLKVVNEASRYVDQSGQRPGSNAVYMEPWHSDIEDFVLMKRPLTEPHKQATDIFYAMWIPDEFMRTIHRETELMRMGHKDVKLWYLMTPSVAQDLYNLYDEGYTTSWLPEDACLNNYAFTKRYRQYIAEGKFVKAISAVSLYNAILTTEIETGVPYYLYKDSINRKSNQKNIGCIRGSNLCAEIAIVSNAKETGVCNLASISLHKLVQSVERQEGDTVINSTISIDIGEANKVDTGVDKTNTNNTINNSTGKTNTNNTTNSPINKIDNDRSIVDNTISKTTDDATNNGIGNAINSPPNPLDNIGTGPRVIYQTNLLYILDPVNNKPTYMTINWNLMEKIVDILVVNIDKIIDINYYTSKKAKYSNMRNRPIGIGVQGLADLFTILKIPFDSKQAIDLTTKLHERLYYYALNSSCKLAERLGAYTTYPGSPLSKGELHFDLWNKEQLCNNPNFNPIVPSINFTPVRNRLAKSGSRVSLMLAMMPTATTGFIMGNSPCFEPHGALFMKRKNKAGEFILVNKYLAHDLTALGLWDNRVINEIFTSRVGGIGHVSHIPQIVRDIYKTCFEIEPINIMKRAMVSAPYVDQTMSLNMFIKTPTSQQIAALHNYAWKSGAKTASYYLRRLSETDSQKVQLTNNTIDEVCTKKEGCITCSS